MKRWIVVIAFISVTSLSSCVSRQTMLEYERARSEVARLTEEINKYRDAHGQENEALKAQLEEASKGLADVKTKMKTEKMESVTGPTATALEVGAPFANGLFVGAGPLLLAVAAFLRGMSKK